jgi:hypothetical protein
MSVMVSSPYSLISCLSVPELSGMVRISPPGVAQPDLAARIPNLLESPSVLPSVWSHGTPDRAAVPAE